MPPRDSTELLRLLLEWAESVSGPVGRYDLMAQLDNSYGGDMLTWRDAHVALGWVRPHWEAFQKKTPEQLIAFIKAAQVEDERLHKRRKEESNEPAPF